MKSANHWSRANIAIFCSSNWETLPYWRACAMRLWRAGWKAEKRSHPSLNAECARGWKKSSTRLALTQRELDAIKQPPLLQIQANFLQNAEVSLVCDFRAIRKYLKHTWQYFFKYFIGKGKINFEVRSQSKNYRLVVAQLAEGAPQASSCTNIHRVKFLHNYIIACFFFKWTHLCKGKRIVMKPGRMVPYRSKIL